MGQFISREMKQEIYQRVSKINDRAFSLVTIFVMSISLTAIDLSFHFVDKSANLVFAFSALAALVITTIVSSGCKDYNRLREVSAFLCLFLWLYVINLTGALQSNNPWYLSIFYAVLCWSNINLLGVMINARK